tara:strand:- start:5973 stop:6575 length:603 start_codon:yes stop_codon:yes gene_type:complete
MILKVTVSFRPHFGGSDREGSTMEDEAASGDGQEPAGQSFRIGFLVHDVSRVRRTLFDLKMKPYGITRSQWWVLAQLSRYLSRNGEEGMLQTELAKRLDVGKVAVGGLIDRLEASGFVERRPDAKDRRAKRVVVTDKGRDVLATMVEVGHELNDMIFEGVPIERMRIAEEVLAQMKDNILRSFEGESEGGVRGGGPEPLD